MAQRVHSNLVKLYRRGGATMLWTIFVILLIAWLLGSVGVYQIGAFVWILFVAAIIALIIQLVSGRRTVL